MNQPGSPMPDSERSASDFDFAGQCWFLTGPTAAGKTEIALRLARHLNAEICSLDSMAVYRGMNLGTAKPTAAERASVPHHLIDLVSPAEPYSLAQYLTDAQAACQSILNRRRRVLFVGGTPLYLKALLRGLWEGPPPDWTLRAKYEELRRVEGGEALRLLLAKVDPTTAERFHENDARRIIRALEVYEKTGTPISIWQQHFDRPVPQDQCRVFLLGWPRAELYDRVNRRVDRMYAAGLVDEVQQLLANEPLGRTALQALGYRETIAHLKGEMALDETITLVKTRTRQFAKRQCTWFRHLSECREISISATTPADHVMAQILASTDDATAS